jgi:hypothetical protein
MDVETFYPFIEYSTVIFLVKVWAHTTSLTLPLFIEASGVKHYNPNPLNSNAQHFHLYQQKEQSPLTSNP